MHGWLILDKPSGITSAQAVHKVKKLLKPKKIGHAGTLDPLASGVLPLALGEATKTIPYMVDKHKSYRFTVAWGEERDTDDSEGGVKNISKNRPKESEISDILVHFRGKIMQIPPIFSAIKVAGERSYALARAGEAIELKPREIEVGSLTLESYTPDTATFICHCGKGTYIRSLARDMGQLLGCFGYVSKLRRLSVGKFSENDAISLDYLAEIVHKDAPLTKVLPVESALDDILALDITPDQATLLKRGQPCPVTLVSKEETVLTREGGKAVALCSLSQGTMKPVRVFNL